MFYDLIEVKNDRIFWIYFIITIFAIIIGVSGIMSTDDYSLLIIGAWILVNVLLTIMIYLASGCIIDFNNKFWLFINIIYIIVLIISVLWAYELNNTDPGPLRDLSGILVLFGGILLIGLTYDELYSILFWIAVVYLLIWYILTLYTII